ncbi:VOC family protein [Amycolatopsis sp. NPDC051071]|uniref:VOC family protein n=1 Tax=Amycolatopsis sp. NPDC051071 TaxID=3154637 RepID=UPI00342B4C0B
MAVVLNHTIVRAADQDAAALFFAELLDLRVGERTGPFTPVQVNDDLTLDFDQRHAVVPAHFGFLVDDTTFDDLTARLAQWPHVSYGSGPEGGWDRSINHLGGGRGVYVGDPNGHSYEFFTAVPPS